MTLETYKQGREALRDTIVAVLAEDDRIVAAWLTGSYARGEADTLCPRGDIATAQPAAERLAFFSRFGAPANAKGVFGALASRIAGDPYQFVGATIRPPSELDHLLLGNTPDNIHNETDWGASLGQEV